MEFGIRTEDRVSDTLEIFFYDKRLSSDEPCNASQPNPNVAKDYFDPRTLFKDGVTNVQASHILPYFGQDQDTPYIGWGAKSSRG